MTRYGGALGFDGEMSYELRPQPKGDTWENSGIPYKQLTADQLKSLLENKKMTLHKNNYSILGAGLFTYPTVEKGTWDIASYDSKILEALLILQCLISRLFHIISYMQCQKTKYRNLTKKQLFEIQCHH